MTDNILSGTTVEVLAKEIKEILNPEERIELCHVLLGSIPSVYEGMREPRKANVMRERKTLVPHYRGSEVCKASPPHEKDSTICRANWPDAS